MMIDHLWMEAVKAALNTKPISRSSPETRDGAVLVLQIDRYDDSLSPPLKRTPKPVRDIRKRG